METLKISLNKREEGLIDGLIKSGFAPDRVSVMLKALEQLINEEVVNTTQKKLVPR